MHNFHHEIPLPEDRAIRKFLWDSYFHDSAIQEVFLDEPTQHAMSLKVDCSRDDSTYLLQFHGVAHFEYSSPRNGWHTGEEISSTVFKDSALLHRLQRDNVKKLYHLRFSHWDGFTDVIFERFTIRRVGGRVSYRSDVPMEAISWDKQYMAPNFRFSLKKDPFVEDIHHLSADDAEDLMEQVDDILWTRLYLLHVKDEIEGLLDLARSILAAHRTCCHAALYAAFLLGKYGTGPDIPMLISRYLSEQNLLKKRVLMDAIELINERQDFHS